MMDGADIEPSDEVINLGLPMCSAMSWNNCYKFDKFLKALCKVLRENCKRQIASISAR